MRHDVWSIQEFTNIHRKISVIVNASNNEKGRLAAKVPPTLLPRTSHISTVDTRIGNL